MALQPTPSDTDDAADLFSPSLFINERCADYDLTGQVLWPAAHLLAAFIDAREGHLAKCAGACELGAGLGLVGLLAAQACPVTLTDHSDVVLSVLRRNAAANPGPHPVRVLPLDWGNGAGIAAGYDLVLGADVCYSVKALPALFTAAAGLLARRPGAEFWLGYVSRAAGIDRSIHAEAAAAGLQMREAPGTRQRVPGGLEGVVYTCCHGDMADTGAQ